MTFRELSPNRSSLIVEVRMQDSTAESARASLIASIAGAAIFSLPLRKHLYAGFPSVLLIPSPLLSLVLWRGGAVSYRTRPYAIVGILMMALEFLAFAPNLFIGYPGVQQRCFHVG